MNIYVASSWRNEYQPTVVQKLREAGHEVYDFKNPAPGDDGFGWKEIDPDWRQWTPDAFRKALDTTQANRGFRLDMDALKKCDACVLVLPCGRSAHLELGYAVGAGKLTMVLLAERVDEPELMYKMCDRICLTIEEVINELSPTNHPYRTPAVVDSEPRRSLPGPGRDGFG